MWASVSHKLDTERLTDQNGLGTAEKWASVSPCIQMTGRHRQRRVPVAVHPVRGGAVG